MARIGYITTGDALQDLDTLEALAETKDREEAELLLGIVHRLRAFLEVVSAR